MKGKVFKPAAIGLLITLGLGSAEALASGFHRRGHGLHGRHDFIQDHRAHRFFGSPGLRHHRGFDSRHFSGFQSRRFLKPFREHHPSFHPGSHHRRFHQGFRHRQFDHGFHHRRFRHEFRHRQFDHGIHHPGFHFRID
jgi:hypothetical protein